LICRQQIRVQETKHTQRSYYRKQPLNECLDGSPRGWQSLVPVKSSRKDNSTTIRATPLA
jgi:hypothetical protein